MLYLYSLFMYLLTPLVLCRLWWKGKRMPEYRQGLSERFGIAAAKKVDIWLHAVSLGEVNAAILLIQALLKQQYTLLITTTTPTGSARVKSYFGNQVAHQYLPYDLPLIQKHFLQKIQPKMVIIMETELWPNLINQIYKAKIPLLLANARLSEKSYKGYSTFKYFFKPILKQISYIAAQSKEDAQRFIGLGANINSVKIFGNMKYDLSIKKSFYKQLPELKTLWGKDRVVLMVASTHDNEEAQILSCLRQLQQVIPNVLLLIAPRHPERFQQVYQLSQQEQFNTGLRSHLGTVSTDTEVLVVDSLGELLAFYELSDYAFVGGSLVPVGGHNVLEPIALEIPVISGHYVHNAQALFNELEQEEAIILVRTADELIKAMIRLHQNPDIKEQMVRQANAVFQRNKGALKRHLDLVLCSFSHWEKVPGRADEGKLAEEE